MSARSAPAALHAQREFGGRHRIVGTVDRLGDPGAYRVMLLSLPELRLVAEARSDAAGAYVIPWLRQGPHYCAVAFDHTAAPVVAAISDQLTLEPMP